MPTLILPIKEIIKIFREEGICTVVDGAHAPGAISFSLRDLDPDIYISTIQKWTYTPRSVGFIYVKREFHTKFYPSCIIEYQNDNLQGRATYLGLRDYTNIYTIFDALEFRKYLGDEKIKEYIRKTVYEGSQIAASLWGTKLFIDDKEKLPSMVCVKFPIQDRKIMENQSKLGKEVFELFKTYPVFVEYQDEFYVRFSAQIYSEQSDFEYCAKSILNYIKILKQQGDLL